ncbi:COG2426 family protein [Alkaliphilus hydrothermalis]|uniref:Membrane protein n=1 Tax=Alkaliphilus hydrothermalis TaxID=1482730 RepID=A0ABS2NQZ6_9FIRM|nr:small multi-drug export protein [Alkaliphilus hydrothermalis]MBM7615361.1 putative membrane protein [Alkaliphilus hydrothermalis]
MEHILELLTREMMVIIIAAMPLMELRGAIPIGVSLGMHPLHATILGILGSITPVPILLIYLKPIFQYLRGTKLFRKLVDRTVQRTLNKSSKVKKYSALGLMIFVALPLPTTGVWSGCLAAILFNIPFKQAFPAIVIGTTLAGCIMFVLSFLAISI